MQISIPVQNERILNYIKEKGSITQSEASSEISVGRLASRIFDLRRKGYNIVDEWAIVKNQYGETCRVKRYSFGG